MRFQRKAGIFPHGQVFAHDTQIAFDEAGPFRASQKPDGPGEILVVILTIRLIGERVHLVRRCREQQYPGTGVLEDRIRELDGDIVLLLIGFVEEISESLEFVEDHEGWLKVADRSSCNQLAYRADQLIAPPTHVTVRLAVDVGEFPRACLQFFP